MAGSSEDRSAGPSGAFSSFRSAFSSDASAASVNPASAGHGGTPAVSALEATAQSKEYRPRSMASLMETPDQNPPIGETLPAALPKDRPVNALSTMAIRDLYGAIVQASRLRLMKVETGGQEPKQVRFSTFRAGAGPNKPGGKVREAAQAQCWAKKDSRAWKEFREYCYKEKLAVPASIKFNVSHVCWRYDHRDENGECRLLPIGLEVSHGAEPYHVEGRMEGKVGEGFKPGCKVELTNLETAECNESRKFCTATGAMWRKAGTGDLITPEEKDTYRGPTQCWHSNAGVPCWAPFPEGEGTPTYLSPHRARNKTGMGAPRDRDEGESPVAAKKLKM